MIVVVVVVVVVAVAVVVAVCVVVMVFVVVVVVVGCALLVVACWWCLWLLLLLGIGIRIGIVISAPGQLSFPQRQEQQQLNACQLAGGKLVNQNMPCCHECGSFTGHRSFSMLLAVRERSQETSRDMCRRTVARPAT